MNAQKGESVDSDSLILSIIEPPRPHADAEINLESPFITLIGNDPQAVIKDSSYIEAGATAYDPEDGDLTESIVIDSSDVNTNALGTYTVTYHVVDTRSNRS